MKHTFEIETKKIQVIVLDRGNCLLLEGEGKYK